MTFVDNFAKKKEMSNNDKYQLVLRIKHLITSIQHRAGPMKQYLDYIFRINVKLVLQSLHDHERKPIWQF